MSLYDDKTTFWRYAMAFRRPINNVLLTNLMERDPHEVMEELREADPDGHANLSEHIVLPPRPEQNTESRSK